MTASASTALPSSVAAATTATTTTTTSALIPVDVQAQVLSQASHMPSALEIAHALSMCTMSFANATLDDTHPLCQQFHLERLVIIIRDADAKAVSFFRAKLNVLVFRFCEDDAPVEQLLSMDDGEQSSAVFSKLGLPSKSLDGVWTNLHFPPEIKQRLLCYASSSMLFSDLGVDRNVVSATRMVLLYGPPGTGKTSLCKGLAQQLAINFSARFSTAHLVEVNSQAIFSKWFSESAKTVQKLFELIFELASTPRALVVVLLDEVESLVASRTRGNGGGGPGGDPSDALRVVNAMLLQLDKLKRYANVVMLCTSNVTHVLDDAFLDRADLRLFVGPPSPQACFDMLLGALVELVRVGLVQAPVTNGTRDALGQLAAELSGSAASGRFLRKLPLQAHVRLAASDAPVPADEFVRAMAAVAQDVGSLTF